MKWFLIIITLLCLSFINIPSDEDLTIKAEVNGNIYEINDPDNAISASHLTDSIRINLKVYLDGEDASGTHYIFAYEVKLKKGEKTKYQMNYKRGQEYNFFPPTAKEMIEPGDIIEFTMTNFTFEEEDRDGIQTQMLPNDMRKLVVKIVE